MYSEGAQVATYHWTGKASFLSIYMWMTVCVRACMRACVRACASMQVCDECEDYGAISIMNKIFYILSIYAFDTFMSLFHIPTKMFHYQSVTATKEVIGKECWCILCIFHRCSCPNSGINWFYKGSKNTSIKNVGCRDDTAKSKKIGVLSDPSAYASCCEAGIHQPIVWSVIFHTVDPPKGDHWLRTNHTL